MNEDFDDETLLLRDLEEFDPLGCENWYAQRYPEGLHSLAHKSWYALCALRIIFQLKEYAPEGGRDTVAYVIASVIRRAQRLDVVMHNDDYTVSDVVRCLGVADRFIARRKP